MQQLPSPLVTSKNHELYIVVYILMIHTVSNTGGKTNFIHILHRNCKKKKKDQNYLYCISKTRHRCATSAYVFLAPVASSPKWVLLRCHSRARSSPEVERGREREGVRAMEICRCRPPLSPPTGHPAIELPMWHIPPSPLALPVRWNIPGDSHLLRQKKK